MPANSRLRFKSNINSFENQFLPRKQAALPGLLQHPECCSPTRRACWSCSSFNGAFGNPLGKLETWAGAAPAPCSRRGARGTCAALLPAEPGQETGQDSFPGHITFPAPRCMGKLIESNNFLSSWRQEVCRGKDGNKGSGGS